MKYKNIAIIAAKKNSQALSIKDKLVKQFNFIDLTNNHNNVDNIDLIIAVGGDGLMLHLLHEYENKPIAIYGVNCGSVGFLMNSLNEQNFLASLENARQSSLHPLRMQAIDCDGVKHSHIAINEVSLWRQSNQAAKIKIEINGQERIDNLTADGVLVATSAGSTAYNLSVRGPIIPFGADVIALTPISPFRPRNWRGALLPSNSKVRFEILNSDSRPVNATADSNEIKNVKEVLVFEDRSINFKILFDHNHSLEERIIREQFSY